MCLLQTSLLVGGGDQPAGALGQHAPTLAARLIQMVDFEAGELRGNDVRQRAALGRTEHDIAVHHAEVHRQGEEFVACLEDDPTHAARGEPPQALLSPHSRQPGTHAWGTLSRRPVATAAGQFLRGRLQRIGEAEQGGRREPDNRLSLRLQVLDEGGGDAGAPAELLTGEPARCPPARYAPTEVTGIAHGGVAWLTTWP